MDLEQLRKELLRDIELKGSTDDSRIDTNNVVATKGHINMYLTRDAGKPRIKSYLTKKFSTIILQPKVLSILNPFEIRCCICNNVISYPCFYWVKEYNVNKIHFFVCFSPNGLDSSCYRRS